MMNTEYLEDSATETAASLARQLEEARAEIKAATDFFFTPHGEELFAGSMLLERIQAMVSNYEGMCDEGERELGKARAECERLRKAMLPIVERVNQYTMPPSSSAAVLDRKITFGMLYVLRDALASSPSVMPTVTEGLSVKEAAELWRAEVEAARAEAYTAGVAAERERCAGIAESSYMEYTNGRIAGEAIAAAIRAGDEE